MPIAARRCAIPPSTGARSPLRGTATARASTSTTPPAGPIPACNCAGHPGYLQGLWRGHVGVGHARRRLLQWQRLRQSGAGLLNRATLMDRAWLCQGVSGARTNSPMSWRADLRPCRCHDRGLLPCPRADARQGEGPRRPMRCSASAGWDEHRRDQRPRKHRPALRPHRHRVGRERRLSADHHLQQLCPCGGPLPTGWVVNPMCFVTRRWRPLPAAAAALEQLQGEL